MAADRQVPTSATPGVVAGDSYMDAVSEEIAKLFDLSHITLGTVAGTADVITAVAVPALVGALVDGMKFTLPTGGSANTTAATLDIDGTDRDIVRNDGSATQAGDLPADSRVPLEYDSANGRFVILHPPRAALGADLNYQVFTTSGTWTKPSGLATNALVLVEMWAGGAGGNASGGGNGGGGGGAYRRHLFRASQLGATEAVVVGIGGAAGNIGGGSSFAGMTVYGGGTTTGASGGGGGGQMATGTSAAGSSGGSGGGPAGGLGGAGDGEDSSFGGGAGGGSSSSGRGGDSMFGGGGGGPGAAVRAGNSEYGGGGGAGQSGTAGTSTFGGDGGAPGAAGSVPGGGGGVNAAGARGEVRVLVVG